MDRRWCKSCGKFLPPAAYRLISPRYGIRRRICLACEARYDARKARAAAESLEAKAQSHDLFIARLLGKQESLA